MKRNLGFTLVEMLVALVIFSSAISLVLLGLEQGRQTWFKVSEKISHQGAQYHREQWLATMFTQANSSHFPNGVGQAAPYFMGSTERINFITNAPILGGPGTYAAVMLKFSSAEKGYQLQYFEAPNQDPYYGGHDYFQDDQGLSLISNIERFEIRYLAAENEELIDWAPQGNQSRDQPQWYGTFNSGQEEAMPMMVHVQFNRYNEPTQDWYFTVNRFSSSADPYAQIGAY